MHVHSSHRADAHPPAPPPRPTPTPGVRSATPPRARERSRARAHGRIRRVTRHEVKEQARTGTDFRTVVLASTLAVSQRWNLPMPLPVPLPESLGADGFASRPRKSLTGTFDRAHNPALGLKIKW